MSMPPLVRRGLSYPRTTRHTTPGRLPGESESHFQAKIIELAHLLGYRAYHTFDSRRSTAGFPDLVLVRPPRLLVIEVKSETGHITAAQLAWLSDLRACGIEVHVFRPCDWQAVTRVLQREHQRQPHSDGQEVTT